MKNFVILITLCLFSASFAQAQSETKVHFNPKVGMNISTLSTEDSENGMRTGLQLGADFIVKSNKESWFFWQPGLHFYHTGVQPVNETTTEAELENQFYYNSLKVPVSGGLYLTGSNGILRIRVNAGITPTILLGVSENQYGVTREDFKGVTVGLNGGVGIEVLIVTLDLSYEHGLTPMLNGNDGINQMFSISAGIRF
ncbi:MAG: outer membrane beta-barrel protein [Cyclobacteriaceae bacterium]